MTAVELGNLALLNLGVSTFITATTDPSQEALTLTKVYDHTLRAVLRRFPWAFATKYAPLNLAAGPFWSDDPAVLTTVQAWSSAAAYEIGDVVRQASVNYACKLAHTNQVPPNATYWQTTQTVDYANGDWTYSYRYPTDCLYARRIIPPWMVPTGRMFDRTPVTFRRHRDQQGLLISTHLQEAQLEYTMLDCIDLWTDDLFLKAFTWYLAAAMAPSLERSQKVIEALQIAEAYFGIAARADIGESQQEKPGEADWIAGR
ncbi:MAG: hypothetical protein ACREKH_19525 [Candidatus Rokuibacteriota bacterium]